MNCKKCKYDIAGLCSLRIANICERNSFNDVKITNEGIFDLLLHILRKIENK